MKEQKSSDVIRQMLDSAEAFSLLGQHENALEMYKKIVELEPVGRAMYQLGVIYAMGRGIETDYLKAAMWFKKADDQGEEYADQLTAKSTLDYFKEVVSKTSGEILYRKAMEFARIVYPEDNVNEKASLVLWQMGKYYIDKEIYVLSAKCMRAAAEFGLDADAQNALGVLYNHGAGVEKNDLVALYWFELAAFQDHEDAKKDRNGIFHAYAQKMTKAEFRELLGELISYCDKGTADVPKDPKSAEFWRRLKDNIK